MIAGTAKGFWKRSARCAAKCGFLIYSYVLMGNHYHLLLETPKANLVAGMKWFQGTYTARFNARHRLRGHLFSGRYKAVVIDGEEPSYGRAVSDCIHLNPVRARIVRPGHPQLRDYGWSSFPALCGREKLPGWLRAAEVLAWHHLDRRRSVDRRRYEDYLQARPGRVVQEKGSPRRGGRTGGVASGMGLGQRSVSGADGRSRGRFGEAKEAGFLCWRGASSPR
jgi:REP element-mobilizing transposase RayT